MIYTCLSSGQSPVLCKASKRCSAAPSTVQQMEQQWRKTATLWFGLLQNRAKCCEGYCWRWTHITSPWFLIMDKYTSTLEQYGACPWFVIWVRETNHFKWKKNCLTVLKSSSLSLHNLHGEWWRYNRTIKTFSLMSVKIRGHCFEQQAVSVTSEV